MYIDKIMLSLISLYRMTWYICMCYLFVCVCIYVYIMMRHKYTIIINHAFYLLAVRARL
jgi:hypothetical protein